ncbi:MAG TPA: hypothetical protein VHN99_02370 [Deinococcales bacterium]|nr:hypothetical protein [Deinococcales bacterium]
MRRTARDRTTIGPMAGAAVLAAALVFTGCARKSANDTGRANTGTAATPPAASATAPAGVAAPTTPALPANLRPNPSLTPGDVLTSDAGKVCRKGYAGTVRNVPSSVKNLVYKRYGIVSRKPGEYEVDHLISLELGGSNSIQNLWPQSYITQPLNAHVKDKLENKLHSLACAGTITLAAAQKAVATDWVAAYQKYVGPLPKGR